MGYCVWADTNERNKVYHDGEWGVSFERCSSC